MLLTRAVLVGPYSAMPGHPKLVLTVCVVYVIVTEREVLLESL